MKNNKLKTLFIIFIGTLEGVIAQNLEFKNYTFSDKTIDIPQKFKAEEEIILEKNSKIEFVFNQNESVEYYLFHEKKLLNSNNSIERNNKVYIPYSEKDNLIENKLRVILPNGKKIELKNSDIKKEVNEENGVSYEYFAVNGLEKGAIIERFYILKSPADLSGTTLYIQNDAPVLKSTIELIYPNYLEFASKIYNNPTETIVKKDAYEGKNSLSSTIMNIPSLNEDEKQSNWKKNVIAFRYKLNANTARGTENLYTHKDFVSSFLEPYYTSLDKKEIKDLEKFVSTVKKDENPLIYIRSVESLIKENIQYNRYFKLNKSVSDILKNKQANLFDLLRLYIAALDQLKIENEIVFTTEKSKTYFDPEFETYNNIQDLLIYIPSSNSFIEPAATNYRTPLFDYGYGENHGLFIKTREYQNIKLPVTSTRKIEFPKDLNHDYMNIVIDASKGIDNATIKSNIKFGGYTASYFQSTKEQTDATNYTEMLQFIAKQYVFEFTEKPTVTTENDGTNNLALKPYIVNIEGSADDLITKAGQNYLVKIGSVIGKQMEMYSEKERQLPIEIDFPHFYTRNITFIIPEGFRIKNPEILDMNYSLKKENGAVADFVSKHKIEGNTLTIENTENYGFHNLPLSDYPEYRKIINAAADFHKLNLILEKI